MKRLMMVLAGGMLLLSQAATAEMKCKNMEDCDKMRGEGMSGMSMEMPDKCAAMSKGTGNIGKYMRMKDELGLTPEQETKFDQIVSEFQKNAIKQKADLKIAKIELRDALKKDAPDFAAAREKVKQITAIEEQMELSTIEMQEKGYAVLTSEQQQKLQQMKKTRKPAQPKKQ
ncbi:MAG: hypothetical protein A2219_03735 [Elusimicrobia bacterium RIFOXYA2_FULL_50_26]|nr:MAG: hypothetical protein A2219_03735 [Elusimicrobia bacterium RIFOXYA2_FULL_50_26]OGS24103.1 MAG: hypothetical protein A2314_02980 [Elusimicrobia bacterium RIFOXYB2_FULL_50_12]